MKTNVFGTVIVFSALILGIALTVYSVNTGKGLPKESDASDKYKTVYSLDEIQKDILSGSLGKQIVDPSSPKGSNGVYYYKIPEAAYNEIYYYAATLYGSKYPNLIKGPYQSEFVEKNKIMGSFTYMGFSSLPTKSGLSAGEYLKYYYYYYTTLNGLKIKVISGWFSREKELSQEQKAMIEGQANGILSLLWSKYNRYFQVTYVASDSDYLYLGIKPIVR